MNGLTIALALLFVAGGYAQVVKFGSCPDVKLQENFEPAKYFSGKYYEQKRFWAIFEVGSKCVNAEYKVLDDNKVQVNNSGTSIKDGSRFFQVGDAYCDQDTKSKCFVRFYEFQPYGKYQLLAADPDKYGLVYSCREIIPGLVNTQFAWILTRDKTVSDADMLKYLDVFKQNGVDVNTFQNTVQDCPDN